MIIIRKMVRLSLCLITLLVFASLSHAQTNRALLIGIDNYPPNSGWRSLHGTNDILLIYPLLIENKYKKTDIVILQNEKATKSAIVLALEKLGHIAKLGDHIYVHFSTHGQQMVDDSGDEDDGLDEALIPYDAKRKYYEGIYEGQNHLRDDQLGALLETIRKKIGSNGNIVVVLDACHSATATRWVDDDEYVRGTSYIFAPDHYDQSKRVEGKLILSLNKDVHLSPITILSACGEDELNYEYRTPDNNYYGSLTYALYSILKTETTPKSTGAICESLGNKVNQMFQAKRWKQTPYYETTNPYQIFRLGK